ncbi:MAG: hypothetical protein K2H83_09765 [Duncaniella sp.]|nr:hypothetical protein [Duncaniella sp.]MDE6179346.1 hypothetical protein [Duncaniella sp.]
MKVDSGSSLTRRLAEDVGRFVAERSEILFNEHDFQMHLAVWLNMTRRYDGVEIEYYVPNSMARDAGYEWDSNLKLDLVVRSGGEYAVIELKYPTRKVVSPITRFGALVPDVEVVKNHGAQDLVSYHFWKDVRRIEIVRSLFPDSVKGGLAVILTNEPYYLKGPGAGTICEAFSTAQGRSGVHGKLDWTRQTKTAEGNPGFRLDGHYSVEWHPAEFSGEKFNYAIITI